MTTTWPTEMMNRDESCRSLPVAPLVDRASIERAAWAIETDGLAGLDDFVQAFADRALRAGCSPILVRLVSDADAPEVVRIRAFGRLAVQFGAVQSGRARPSTLRSGDRAA